MHVTEILNRAIAIGKHTLYAICLNKTFYEHYITWSAFGAPRRNKAYEAYALTKEKICYSFGRQRILLSDVAH